MRIVVPTLGLSLWQPWAGVIARGWKDIENRSWALPPKYRTATVAIHAAKRKTDFEDDLETVARILGQDVQGLRQDDAVNAFGAVVGVMLFDGYTTKSDSKWFFGPCGFKIAQAIALPSPVPCRGAQGFFRLPDDVRQEVEKRLVASMAGRTG